VSDLLSPETAHSQLCGIFEQVNPETGRFLKKWEPRGFDDCESKGHDKDGRCPDEPPDSP